MATNIDVKSLNAMFNDYLQNGSSDQAFVDYCLSQGYFHTDSNDPTVYDFSKFRKSRFVNTAYLTSNPEKYNSYLTFLANLSRSDSRNQLDGDKATSKMLMDLMEDVPLNAGLGLSQQDSEQLYSKYLQDSDHKMKKMHPKTAFAGKKIGIPTLITTAICAVIGGAIAASGLVAGAIPFLTDSLLLNIGSLATLGAAFGAVITPIAIVAKNAIVRSYFARKYGTKTNNLATLLNSDITNSADIEKLNLPINELFKKFKKTEEKIQKAKHSKNPFSRIANYFREKTNRNRLHEVINVLKKTNENLKNSQDPTTETKLGLFQRYLVDQTKNLELSRRYADILARSRVDKKEKNHIADLKASHKDEYKKLAMDVLSKGFPTPASPVNVKKEPIKKEETVGKVVEKSLRDYLREYGENTLSVQKEKSFIEENKHRTIEELRTEYNKKVRENLRAQNSQYDQNTSNPDIARQPNRRKLQIFNGKLVEGVIGDREQTPTRPQDNSVDPQTPEGRRLKEMNPDMDEIKRREKYARIWTEGYEKQRQRREEAKRELEESQKPTPDASINPVQTPSTSTSTNPVQTPSTPVSPKSTTSKRKTSGIGTRDTKVLRGRGLSAKTILDGVDYSNSYSNYTIPSINATENSTPVPETQPRKKSDRKSTSDEKKPVTPNSKESVQPKSKPKSKNANEKPITSETPANSASSPKTKNPEKTATAPRSKTTSSGAKSDTPDTTKNTKPADTKKDSTTKTSTAPSTEKNATSTNGSKSTTTTTKRNSVKKGTPPKTDELTPADGKKTQRVSEKRKLDDGVEPKKSDKKVANKNESTEQTNDVVKGTSQDSPLTEIENLIARMSQLMNESKSPIYQGTFTEENIDTFLENINPLESESHSVTIRVKGDGYSIT